MKEHEDKTWAAVFKHYFVMAAQHCFRQLMSLVIPVVLCLYVFFHPPEWLRCESAYVMSSLPCFSSVFVSALKNLYDEETQRLIRIAAQHPWCEREGELNRIGLRKKRA